MASRIEDAVLYKELGTYWYVFLLHGLLLVTVGCLFLFYPITSWTVTSVLFGCFALCDAGFGIGKACVVTCCMGPIDNKCAVVTMYLLNGLCSFGIGTIAIASPAATAEAFLIFLSLWMLLTGMSQVWLATLLGVDGSISGASWCSGIIGVIYVMTGISILTDLAGNIFFFIFFIGISLVILGFQMVFASCTVKSAANDYTRIGEALDV